MRSGWLAFLLVASMLPSGAAAEPSSGPCELTWRDRFGASPAMLVPQKVYEGQLFFSATGCFPGDGCDPSRQVEFRVKDKPAAFFVEIVASRVSQSFEYPEFQARTAVRALVNLTDDPSDPLNVTVEAVCGSASAPATRTFLVVRWPQVNVSLMRTFHDDEGWHWLLHANNTGNVPLLLRWNVEARSSREDAVWRLPEERTIPFGGSEQFDLVLASSQGHGAFPVLISPYDALHPERSGMAVRVELHVESFAGRSTAGPVVWAALAAVAAGLALRKRAA